MSARTKFVHRNYIETVRRCCGEFMHHTGHPTEKQNIQSTAVHRKSKSTWSTYRVLLVFNAATVIVCDACDACGPAVPAQDGCDLSQRLRVHHRTDWQSWGHCALTQT